MTRREEEHRTGLLLGEKKLEKLHRAHVAVFGIGGVGSFCAEALARAGVGKLTLIDGDTVAPSNINRQIIALHSTIGKEKADVMKERIADINPLCEVTARALFYLPENADTVDISSFDYVVDAVDTVAAKIELAVRCQSAGVPLISAMGTGNKLDPTQLEVSDLSKTAGCPLARVMRYELKKRGITHLKVVYSKEAPIPRAADAWECDEASGKRPSPGSVSFVPPVAGMILAGEVVKEIVKAES